MLDETRQADGWEEGQQNEEEIKRLEQANKELEKLKLALKKMEEFSVQCQNNGNFNTLKI